MSQANNFNAYRELDINRELKAQGASHRIQPCQGNDCGKQFQRPKNSPWKTLCYKCYNKDNEIYLFANECDDKNVKN